MSPFGLLRLEIDALCSSLVLSLIAFILSLLPPLLASLHVTSSWTRREGGRMKLDLCRLHFPQLSRGYPLCIGHTLKHDQHRFLEVERTRRIRTQGLNSGCVCECLCECQCMLTSSDGNSGSFCPSTVSSLWYTSTSYLYSEGGRLQ